MTDRRQKHRGHECAAGSKFNDTAHRIAIPDTGVVGRWVAYDEIFTTTLKKTTVVIYPFPKRMVSRDIKIRKKEKMYLDPCM